MVIVSTVSLFCHWIVTVLLLQKGGERVAKASFILSFILSWSVLPVAKLVLT